MFSHRITTVMWYTVLLRTRRLHQSDAGERRGIPNGQIRKDYIPNN